MMHFDKLWTLKRGVVWMKQQLHLSRVMRKSDFCLGENKGADQLCSNCPADQRLCFRYSDSTIPRLLISKISSFYLSSVTVHPGLCQTWSETQTVCFLTHRLIYLPTIICSFSEQCFLIRVYISTVKRVLALLNMESRSLIRAAIITAIIKPRKPEII